MLENSGDVLVGGLVCYDAKVKETVLQIDPAFIRKYTPESAEVTQAMAQHFRKFVPSDITVALTGLTTAGGSENPEKPVGTMFLHFIFPWGEKSCRRHFEGNAQEILDQTLLETARLISAAIESPGRSAS
jgi:nicotinamide-nucleotide amidase